MVLISNCRANQIEWRNEKLEGSQGGVSLLDMTGV